MLAKLLLHLFLLQCVSVTAFAPVYHAKLEKTVAGASATGTRTKFPTYRYAGAKVYSSSNDAGSSPLKRLDPFLSKATSAFPLWVVAAAIWGLKQPAKLAWVNQGQTIEAMLAFVMVGMGMTLETKDFSEVLSKNFAAVPFGVVCQFGIMPLSAWYVGKKMLLPINPSLYLGLALVGCSPGGTASNLVSLIAGANVALSVILTACSTLLAAIVTPLLVKLLVGGTEIVVSGKALCVATAKVVLGPVLIGMLLNSKLPKLSKEMSRFTPFASVLMVALICGGVVARNVHTLSSVGSLFPKIFSAVLATHLIGFVFGYIVPKFLGRFKESTARTISIETGMQNSALAVVLAQAAGAPPLAALPGALSAVTHSCLGSLFAAYWRILNVTGRTPGDYGVRDDGSIYEI